MKIKDNKIMTIGCHDTISLMPVNISWNTSFIRSRLKFKNTKTHVNMTINIFNQVHDKIQEINVEEFTE